MIVLSSSSPTRAKILKEHGVEFIQKSCDFDEESLDALKPEHFVYHVAKGKMQMSEREFGLGNPLLVADTVVVSNSKLLRKAYSVDEAMEMLKLQSANSVSILTCMIYKSYDINFTDLSSTDYLFDEFKDDDLEEYLKTDEWKGKAGACMIEGFCKKYIRGAKGYESCARGLTIEKLLPFMKE